MHVMILCDISVIKMIMFALKSLENKGYVGRIYGKTSSLSRPESSVNVYVENIKDKVIPEFFLTLTIMCTCIMPTYMYFN